MIPFNEPVSVLLRAGGELSGVVVGNPEEGLLLATPAGPAIISRSAVAAIRRTAAAAPSGLVHGDLPDLLGAAVRVTVPGLAPLVGVLVDLWPGRSGVDLRTGTGEVVHVPMVGAAVEALP